jgi:MerR family transcriptional regulator, light-induced transcriptional regulator
VSEPRSLTDLRRAAEARASTLARRFGDVLIVGDRVEAERIVDESLAAGMAPVAIQALVITPAMVRIGELWEAQVISVADEHLATSISHMALIRLFEALSEGRVRRRSRQRVLLAAVSRQHHVLGLRMVADALEGAGFDVIYLGEDVPADSLEAVLRRHRPAVVGLAFGIAGDTRPLADAIATVHATDPEIRIMLGGRAVPPGFEASDYPVVASSMDVVDAVDALLAGPVQALPALVGRLRSGGSAAAAPPDLVDAPDATAEALARAAEQAVDIAREHVRRAEAYRQPAFSDQLTGLGNRRAFDDDVSLICEASGKAGALLMIDIDALGAVNRERGTPGGDRLLRSVGQAISGSVRPGDLVVRFGGDEFAVAMPDATPDAGVATAEEIRSAVDDLADHVTVSVGVAPLATDVRASLLAVNAALYAAKVAGGDRVVVGPGPDAPSVQHVTGGPGGPG